MSTLVLTLSRSLSCFLFVGKRGGLTFALTETGTGDRDRPVTGLSYFLKIRSVTMGDSDPDEDGSAEVSFLWNTLAMLQDAHDQESKRFFCAT